MNTYRLVENSWKQTVGTFVVGSHFNQWPHARWIVSLEIIISSVERRKASGCVRNLLEKLDVQHK